MVQRESERGKAKSDAETKWWDEDVVDYDFMLIKSK
jgi:hypothetical protein